MGWTLRWKPRWPAWVTMKLNPLYVEKNGMLENGLRYFYLVVQFHVINASTTYVEYKS